MSYHDELKSVDFKNTIEVEVVLIGQPIYKFKSLNEARKQFKELDPFRGSTSFTPALDNNGKMRFESWMMNSMFSS